MLKLNSVFQLHTDRISSQIRKSIVDKYAEQIGRCVLTYITESPKQAGDEEEEGRGKING